MLSASTLVKNGKDSNPNGLHSFANQNEAANRDRRRHQRSETKFSSFFFNGRWYNRKKLSGVVTNWSETGVCFETTKEASFVPVGEQLRLAIRFPGHWSSTTLSGTIVRSDFTANGGRMHGMRFEKLLKDYRTESSDTIKKNLITLFSIAVVVALFAIKMEHVRWFWYNPLLRLYTLTTALFIGTRFLLSIIYKEPSDLGYLPSISVIVAVKNEQDNIAETIRYCFDARYPKDRYEVIVIDDGSTDNTWQALEELCPRYGQLRIIKFPQNKGKRHAMAVGANEAKGEILVYVDSDSFVESEGMYRLVQPFADRTVGAVAGHTQVRVENDNVISKMEAVRYFVSHQLFKSAESVFGAVTCCPGAFSAYRRDLVLKVLPAWLNQKFMGVQATFGDDRSLTNYILRTHNVLYHAGAVCHTYVPRKWSQFFRQQLRWKKSWARETTVAARIMIKKNPLAAVSYYIGILLPVLSPIVFLHAIVYGPLVLSTPVTPYLLGVFFVYMALCMYYFLHTYRLHAYCGVLFAFIYMVVLCWQTYYAILTVNRTHWGTR